MMKCVTTIHKHHVASQTQVETVLYNTVMLSSGWSLYACPDI